MVEVRSYIEFFGYECDCSKQLIIMARYFMFSYMIVDSIFK